MTDVRAALPARPAKDGALLSLHLTPGARGEEIAGVAANKDGAPVLKARVRAVAEKGKANEAMIALLAKWLDMPKSRFLIVTGTGTRSKQVLIAGQAGPILEKLRARLDHRE